MVNCPDCNDPVPETWTDLKIREHEERIFRLEQDILWWKKAAISLQEQHIKLQEQIIARQNELYGEGWESDKIP